VSATIGTKSGSLGTFASSLQIEWGQALSGVTIERRYVLWSDGTLQINDFYNGVKQMSLSGDFSPTGTSANKGFNGTTVYATNITTGNANLGQIVELKEVFGTDASGDADPDNVKLYDMSKNPPSDVTSTYVDASGAVAPYNGYKAKPAVVQLTSETLDVTGTTASSLASIPTHAAYAEIYIDASADDALIRWSADGSTPADDSGEQEATGKTIVLTNRAALLGFRALAMDAAGDLDDTLTASLSVTYYNTKP